MRWYPAIVAVIGWLALAAHLALCILGEPLTVAGVMQAVGIYLSFFTILTNILVALALTDFAMRGERAISARPRVATGVATYIAMVELVYTLILRWMWHPSAVQLVVDVLLHDVMPVGYVIFWVRCVAKGRLVWRDAYVWLIYPLAFAFYNAAYSAATSRQNPYPFLDIRVLGLGRVLGFVALLSAAFLIVGWIFVGIDRAMAPQKR